MYGRIEETAKAAGLAIDFDAIKRTPNTIDAHRLIHWSGLEGRQTATVTRLFKAYFENGQDIGNRGVLANTHVLPGAQPTELWTKVLDEIASQSAEA